MVKVISPREKKDLLSYFSNNPNILLAIQFGSHATQYQRDESDIDFALLFEDNISILAEMEILSDLSNILSFENVDLTNLNKAPVSLQFEALRGEIIYEKDYYKTSDFMEYVFKQYASYLPALKSFERDFLERSFDKNDF